MARELDPHRPGADPVEHSTLLFLVRSLLEGRSDEEVVRTAIELVARGRVVLTGNFRASTLELEWAPRRPSQRDCAAK
jgi:hypothetical protein